MKKVSVIGAGNVGASVAQLLLVNGLSDVVLVDIVEGVPQGKGLDLMQAMPMYEHDCRIKGTNDYADIKDSDIVVITAGLPRKPGMSRDDLLEKNASIVKSVSENIKKFAPDSIVIVVSNPLDTMALVAQTTTGFNPNKVIGMAGVLDSARFKAFIAEELDISVNDVETMVLGGHGDTMVPLPEHTLIKGKKISEVLDKERIEKLVNRTRNAGAEIVAHLKTGSAFYAPAAGAVEMIKEISSPTDKTLAVTAYLDGEYGYNGIYVGVPVKLDNDGVKEIIELELSDEAKSLLDISAKDVIENKEKLNI